MNLEPSTDTTYSGLAVSVPSGYELVFQGADGSTTVFTGASPALTVLSGSVFVAGDVTFLNDTNAPTIVVQGGSLTLRGARVEETNIADQAAIVVTGGFVDLGSSDEPGGNTFVIRGAGDLIRNLSSQQISALGNTFQRDDERLSNFEAERAIHDVLDNPESGMVTYVQDETYVTLPVGQAAFNLQALTADLNIPDPAFAIAEKTNGTAEILADGMTVDFSAFTDGPSGFSYTVIDNGDIVALRTVYLVVDNVVPTIDPRTIARASLSEGGILAESGSILASDGGDNSALTAIIGPASVIYRNQDGSQIPIASGSALAGQFALLASKLIFTGDSGGTNPARFDWSISLTEDDVEFLADSTQAELTWIVTVSDTVGSTVEQALTLTVTGANDRAIINGPVTASVVEDGADAIVGGALNLADPDHGETRFQAVPWVALQGTYGSFAFDETTGEWSYTLDNTRARTQSLSGGQEVVERLRLLSADGTADTAILVTITGSDDPSTISGTLDGHVTERGSTSLAAGVLTVSDRDAGEATFRSVDPADLSGTYGNFVFNRGLGQWWYALDNASSAVQGLTAGEEAFDTLTVVSFDGNASETIQIAVTGANNYPRIVYESTDETAQVFEDTDVVTGKLSDSGTITFSDVDLSDVHSTSVRADMSNSLGGTLTMGEIGRDAGAESKTVNWTYSVSNSAAQYLAAGQRAYEFFIVTISDDNGGSINSGVLVTVVGKNDQPNITVGEVDSAAETVVETDNALAVARTLSVEDLDLNDTVEAEVISVTESGDGTGVVDYASLLSMLTLNSNPIIDAANFTGSINWTFNSGAEAFDHLNINESLVLTYTLKVTDNSGATSDPDSDTQTVVIAINGANDEPVGTEIAPATQTLQYSDGITPIEFSFSDVDSELLIPEVSHSFNGSAFMLGLPDAGSLEPGVGLAIAGGSTANGTGFGSTATWTVSGIADLAPGVYDIRLTVSDVEGGSISTESRIIVQREDATATYSGSLFVSTDSVNSGVATVELRATIQDITAALPDGADQQDGNIASATVSFINNTNPDYPVVIGSGLAVTPVDPSDLSTGVAAYSWTVDIGNSDSETFDIVVEVDGFYLAEDLTLVTVSKPLNDAVTGGGYIFNEKSAGLYAGDETRRSSFGFNVKRNKQGTNVQGHVNVIISHGDRTYQIKTNATDSLVALPGVNPDVSHAEFIAKANLRDITDPINPISLGGNLQLIATLTDSGEPGDLDTVAFTLWDGAVLLYSTNWSGTNTVEQLLDGGNIQVRLDRPENLLLDGSAITASSSVKPLASTELATAFQYVVHAWSEFGLHAHELAPFSTVDLRIAPLSGNILGANYANVVWIDEDAAGYGWNVNGLGIGVDLVSVLTHEFGHLLGFDHEVMGLHLEPGVRDIEWLHAIHRLDGISAPADLHNLEIDGARPFSFYGDEFQSDVLSRTQTLRRSGLVPVRALPQLTIPVSEEKTDSEERPELAVVAAVKSEIDESIDEFFGASMDEFFTELDRW